MKKKEPAPIKKPAPSTSTRTPENSTTAADIFDVDTRLVAEFDSSIWRAVYDGHFRLAVPCEICGQPLVALASKLAKIGPKCSAKSGTGGRK